jgi:hypothetical protein
MGKRNSDRTSTGLPVFLQLECASAGGGVARYRAKRERGRLA